MRQRMCWNRVAVRLGISMPWNIDWKLLERQEYLKCEKGLIGAGGIACEPLVVWLTLRPEADRADQKIARRHKSGC